MRIPLVGGTTKNKSVVVSAARSINCYVEMATNDAKVPYYLDGTPGYVLHTTLATQEVRGLWSAAGVRYAVSGNTFYSLDDNGTATSRGTLNTSTGRVSIADNGEEVMVVDGSYGYIYDIAAATFTQITDADFLGATQVRFTDSYFVFAGNNGGIFQCTPPYDGVTVETLDFATAESNPDDATAIIVDRGEVWVYGPLSAEPWLNSPSGTDFPFIRASGRTIDAGIIAPHSLIRANNTLFWLAQDTNGFMGFVAMQGYTPVVVSSPSITAEMSGYATKSDAYTWTYSHGTHQFIVLTFPTEGRTWVYDASIQDPALAWHEWHYFGSQRHRANCHVYHNGAHYIGDYQTGEIFQLDHDTFTDNGETISRRRVASFSSGNGNYLRVDELEVQFQAGVGLATGQGSDPQTMLQVSRNGGNTYGSEMWRDMGVLGDYTARAVWRTLGRARDWTTDITVADPVRFRIVDAFANATEIRR